MSRRVALILAALSFFLAWADDGSAQTASRVIRLIDQRCATCHRSPNDDRKSDAEGAPAWTTLRQMAPETILQAITKGAMRVHAEDVTDDVKRAIAEYISGRKLSPLTSGSARNMPNQCPAGTPMRDPSAGPIGTAGVPMRPTRASIATPGLSAADVPRLTLKWSFGFPGVSSVYGQPTVAGGRVFVGVDTGYVYALDAATGCVHWSFLAETGVRNAVSIGPLKAPPARPTPRTSATSAPMSTRSTPTPARCCGRSMSIRTRWRSSRARRRCMRDVVRSRLVARRSGGRQPQLPMLHVPRQHRRARRGDRSSDLEDLRHSGCSEAVATELEGHPALDRRGCRHLARADDRPAESGCLCRHGRRLHRAGAQEHRRRHGDPHGYGPDPLVGPGLRERCVARGVRPGPHRELSEGPRPRLRLRHIADSADACPTAGGCCWPARRAGRSSRTIPIRTGRLLWTDGARRQDRRIRNPVRRIGR